MAELSHPGRLESVSLAGRARAFLTRHRANLRLLALLVLGAWLALNWSQTIERMLRYYTPVPAWDYWRTAAFLHFYQAFDLRILWQQHNEHRIVFPEIAFAADYLFLHGRQVLPLLLSFLCYVGCWLVLAWAFASDDCVPPLTRKMAILLAGIIIGWQGSAVVLADTFLLQWTLLQFSVLLSLVVLVRLKETSATAYLLATIACATVATYSSANGLALWPILIGAALLLSLSKRHITALILAGFIAIGVYFIGYHFNGTSSITKLFVHPLYLLEFLGAYFSMPFGAIKSSQFGVRLGLFSLLVTAWFAVLAVRRRILGSRPGVVLFGWYLFLLLTALLTAAGRMDPTEPTFSAAKASRYLTGPLVTWAVFVLLCLWLASRLVSRAVLQYFVISVVALLLLLGLPKLRWWLQNEDQAYARQQLAALAIELDLQDANVALGIFLDAQALETWTAYLRNSHLSVFYDPHSRWLGKNLQAFGRINNESIPGEITYTFPVRNGLEVAGWVDESQLRGSTGWILLVSETGSIVGFGRKLPAGFPSVFDNPRTPPTLGWAGFINLKYPTKHFVAYAISQRGLFPIQGSVAVPDLQVSTSQQTGPPITGIQWQMDPGWTINRLPAPAFFGQAPVGPVYGSWSGDERHTGQITSSAFTAPANACLILPVLQGSRDGGLSAAVVDALTNQIVVSVPFQNAVHQWVFWRLPIPASVKQLRIVAQDRGKDWGEWLALGNPAQCR